MRSSDQQSNLLFDPKSRIQTGPAQPTWNWNRVRCIWNGPVTADDTIRPILISLSQHRVLTVVRVALLVCLAVILFRGGRISLPWRGAKSAALAGLLIALIPTSAAAQLPDQPLLDSLRERLLKIPDVYPGAAEIVSVDLTLDGNRIETRSRIHAAIDVAVPLPGKLPEWSPVTVTIGDGEPVLVTRRDGYVWALVPKGVHEVVANGLLGDSGNWELTFLLKPKYLRVDAPNWKISGINPDGVPDSQVFFVEQQPTTTDRAAYDRTDFNPIVVVDRELEIGLVSRIRSTVRRSDLGFIRCQAFPSNKPEKSSPSPGESRTRPQHKTR